MTTPSVEQQAEEYAQCIDIEGPYDPYAIKVRSYSAGYETAMQSAAAEIEKQAQVNRRLSEEMVRLFETTNAAEARNKVLVAALEKIRDLTPISSYANPWEPIGKGAKFIAKEALVSTPREPLGNPESLPEHTGKQILSKTFLGTSMWICEPDCPACMENK